MTRHVCPACRENAPNALNPGGICDDCVGGMGWDEAERQVAMAGYEIMPDGSRRSMYAGGRRGYNATPCTCGQHYDLDRNGRCLACRASAGLWRSVAAENVIDDRDARANDAAEREEERERDEAEWAAEQGEEITVEVSW